MQGSVSRVLYHRVRNAAKVSELILGIAPSPPQADREEPPAAQGELSVDKTLQKYRRRSSAALSFALTKSTRFITSLLYCTISPQRTQHPATQLIQQASPGCHWSSNTI